MSLAVGTRLGACQIEGLLGVGGMGEVYRANDTRLDRVVAVKVLPAGITDEAAHRTRFHREAKVISALSHAHICALHDVGHDAGVEYLVLELLQGETLAARLPRGLLPISQVVRLGNQMADALAAAHGVKLLDFGLAKPILLPDPSALAATVVGDGPATAEGSVVGTLQYMAPEQVQGLAAHARTDIFALGAVLYEMVTGHRPFGGPSQAQVIASILNADPHPITKLAPLAPPALEAPPDTPEISPDGRWLVYSAWMEGRRQLVLREWASHEGKVLPGGEGATLPFWSPDSRSIGFFAEGLADPDQYMGMRLSPSGRRAAVWKPDAMRNVDIWDVHLASGILSRMTTDPASDSDAAWSPESSRMAFSSNRTGPSANQLAVYVKDVESGREELITQVDGQNTVVDGWTPDGGSLVVRTTPTTRATYLVPVDGDRTPRLLGENPFVKDELEVSPDGRWVASNESGDWEVYIATFPALASKRRVSTAGGVQPHWRGDGRELFCLGRDSSLMSVPIIPGPGLETGRSVVLFSTDIDPSPNLPQYGVTRDGQRFLGLSRGEPEREQLRVLLNWMTPEHLARR